MTTDFSQAASREAAIDAVCHEGKRVEAGAARSGLGATLNDRAQDRYEQAAGPA